MLALLCATLAAGCSAVPYDPSRATRPYPFRLHTTEPPADIQVFRHGGTLLFNNATLRSFEEVDVWINQRYVARLAALEAGGQSSVAVSDLWDRWGNGPIPGGIFRRARPTPIRLVELQLDETSPLVGVIVIRTEPAE